MTVTRRRLGSRLSQRRKKMIKTIMAWTITAAAWLAFGFYVATAVLTA